jgi:hypothetical protein
LWLGIGAGAVAILVISLIAARLLSGPKPEDALDAARVAFLNRDQAGFDKYVDVQSVLGDWVDQSAKALLAKNETGALGAMAVQAALPTLKTAFLPTAAQAIDRFIVSGAPTSEQGAGGENPVGAVLMSYLSSATRQLAGSQLTYLGVDAKNVVGDDASLNVSVASPLRNDPIHLKLRMHRFGDYWRIVAVDDMLGLLRQLTGSSGSQGNSVDTAVANTSAGGPSGAGSAAETNASPPGSPVSSGGAAPEPANELPYPGDAPSARAASAPPNAPPKNIWPDEDPNDPFGGNGGFIKPAQPQSQ